MTSADYMIRLGTFFLRSVLELIKRNYRLTQPILTNNDFQKSFVFGKLCQLVQTCKEKKKTLWFKSDELLTADVVHANSVTLPFFWVARITNTIHHMFWSKRDHVPNCTIYFLLVHMGHLQRRRFDTLCWWIEWRIVVSGYQLSDLFARKTIWYWIKKTNTID